MNLINRHTIPARAKLNLSPKLLICAAAIGVSAQIQAANFSVGPVRLSMSIDSASSVLQLRSGEFKEPIILQATAYLWEQKGNERILNETDGLSISPSVVKLQPGDVVSMIVRPTEKPTSSQYYRLFLEEVIDETKEAKNSQVNFRKTFDLPVFIENSAAPIQITTSLKKFEDGWDASISNKGTNHIALSSMQVNNADKTIGTKQGLVYLLPGSSMEFSIPKTSSNKTYENQSAASLKLFDRNSDPVEHVTQ